MCNFFSFMIKRQHFATDLCSVGPQDRTQVLLPHKARWDLTNLISFIKSKSSQNKYIMHLRYLFSTSWLRHWSQFSQLRFYRERRYCDHRTKVCQQTAVCCKAAEQYRGANRKLLADLSVLGAAEIDFIQKIINFSIDKFRWFI